MGSGPNSANRFGSAKLSDTSPSRTRAAVTEAGEETDRSHQNDGMGLVAKRVEIVPRSDPLRLRIVLDNERCATYDVTADEANIVGRIRWFCHELPP
jgi:hypothetical protein